MLQVRVMPCLLLENGKLVKTIKFKDPDYIGDPVNAIKIYNDKEVDELVFLDISATNNDRKPPFEKIAEIADECFMPLAYGGGIKSIADMKKIFSLGVEKCVICSYAVENPDFITEAANLFGSQSVVVSIDIKKNFWGKNEIFTHSGSKGTKLDPIEFAELMEKKGAGEIFLNNIDRDGTMEGYDLDLIKKIAENINIPLIVCGGAGSVEDMIKAVESGASAVAAGAMVVYQSKLRGVLINFPKGDELEKIRSAK